MYTLRTRMGICVRVCVHREDTCAQDTCAHTRNTHVCTFEPHTTCGRAEHIWTCLYTPRMLETHIGVHSEQKTAASSRPFSLHAIDFASFCHVHTYSPSPGGKTNPTAIASHFKHESSRSASTARCNSAFLWRSCSSEKAIYQK